MGNLIIILKIKSTVGARPNFSKLARELVDCSDL